MIIIIDAFSILKSIFGRMYIYPRHRAGYRESLMRLTTDLEHWIYGLVTRYSTQLSIVKPRYVLRVRDLLGLPLEVTRGRRTSAYRYYGVAYIKHNTIFLNVKRTPSLVKLQETIAHEMVHLRFPYLNHGSVFRTKVKKVTNGQQFKPYNKRKVCNFKNTLR